MKSQLFQATWVSMLSPMYLSISLVTVGKKYLSNENVRSESVCSKENIRPGSWFEGIIEGYLFSYWETPLPFAVQDLKFFLATFE